MLPVTDALDSTPFTNLESFPDVEFYAAMNCCFNEQIQNSTATVGLQGKRSSPAFLTRR